MGPDMSTCTSSPMIFFIVRNQLCMKIQILFIVLDVVLRISLLIAHYLAIERISDEFGERWLFRENGLHFVSTTLLGHLKIATTYNLVRTEKKHHATNSKSKISSNSVCSDSQTSSKFLIRRKTNFSRLISKKRPNADFFLQICRPLCILTSY